LKPASPSKDKKLSMECKVILEKLPPTNATVFILQEHESFGMPSSSRGKAVRSGKGRRGGAGRKFKIQDHESFDIPSSSRGKSVRGGKGRRAGTGRNPGTKTEEKSSSQISPITKVNKLKLADVYSSSD
jgi:hypothetical protein